jgi:hypothetical protein
MEEPTATPAQQNRALSQLLSAVDSLITDFAADIDSVLRPAIEDTLEESGQNQWLGEVLRSFGWQDGSFTAPVDVRALSSRLRALVYEGCGLQLSNGVVCLWPLCEAGRGSAMRRAAFGLNGCHRCRRRLTVKGTGSFAVVYKVSWRLTELCAARRFNFPRPCVQTMRCGPETAFVSGVAIATGPTAAQSGREAGLPVGSFCRPGIA